MAKKKKADYCSECGVIYNALHSPVELGGKSFCGNHCYEVSVGIDPIEDQSDRALAKGETRCCECSKIIHENNIFVSDLHDTPWEIIPTTVYYCGEECRDAYLGITVSKGFAWFDCDECRRTICEQNPANGYMVQYRVVGDDKVCLRCYQDKMLKEGVSLDRIKEGHLDGMFFDRDELRKSGFTEIDDYFINSSSKEAFLSIVARRLETEIVCIDYVRLGHGGGEGTVSIWSKKR